MRTIFRALVTRVWYQYSGGVMLSQVRIAFPQTKTMSGEAGLLEPNVNPITSLLRSWYTSMAFAQL